MAEHVSSLMFPWMLILVVPILALATHIYPWMSLDPRADHALDVKKGLFNKPMFYLLVPLLVASWGLIARTFRRNSLAQDKDGAAKWTFKMRFYSYVGIFIFAISLTFAVIDWMKSLQHQWFSTMYGVYYFAGSVWTTLATLYVLTLALKKAGPLALVAGRNQFHDIAKLFYAFTVFYAYIHFSQYFIIWNGGMPEETFYYVQREQGSWWGIGMLIVFGHFLIPFLAFARIDAKLNIAVAIPVCVWAWLMHYCDMSFNVMPILRPDGFQLSLTDIGCWMFIGGVVGVAWLRSLASHAPYPLKDPRLGEALGIHFHDEESSGSGHAPAKGSH